LEILPQNPIKNFEDDQTLHGISAYRRLSQPLHAAQWWQKKRHEASTTEQGELTALQQHWQAIMPFAFCTSYDLIEKVAVLEELDAYLWLARYHFKQSKTDLPVAFRQKYHLRLKQFSEQMVQVKQAIADMMLGILRAVTTTGDLTCNAMINTEVIPVLKQLGVLLPDTPSITVPGVLDESQFVGLVNFIQSLGTTEQQDKLAQLSLFASHLYDKCPLIVSATGTSYLNCCNDLRK
jgi:hypothetical protein